uniref:Uncharacterized protein n=1 Tax=uncultured Desulfobacterium sp. TaxID=201089 RepID=E1YGQ3_9BACT|nr:unknown protein [uncultured Desulfobacterium sp.]
MFAFLPNHLFSVKKSILERLMRLSYKQKICKKFINSPKANHSKCYIGYITISIFAGIQKKMKQSKTHINKNRFI